MGDGSVRASVSLHAIVSPGGGHETMTPLFVFIRAHGAREVLGIINREGVGESVSLRESSLDHNRAARSWSTVAGERESCAFFGATQTQNQTRRSSLRAVWPSPRRDLVSRVSFDRYPTPAIAYPARVIASLTAAAGTDNVLP